MKVTRTSILSFAIVAFSATLQGCFLFTTSGPYLSIEELIEVPEAEARQIRSVLEGSRLPVGSVRALLAIRAQKLGFAQEVTATYVYSTPGHTRLTMFATQFNRLVALMVSSPQWVDMYLPDEQVVVTGPSTADSMSKILGVEFTSDEFAHWLLGQLPPHGAHGNLFRDRDAARYISEYSLDENRMLRASFVLTSPNRAQIQAIELFRDDHSVFYASTHWKAKATTPYLHSVEFPEKNISVRMAISKIEVSADEVGAEEAQRLFALPELPGIPRVTTKDVESGRSLIAPVQ